MSNDPMWGRGAARGSKIIFDEDGQEVSKGIGSALRALKPLSREAKVVNTSVKAMGKTPGIGSRMGMLTRRTYAHGLGAENTALQAQHAARAAQKASSGWGTMPVSQPMGQGFNKPKAAFGKALPSSAMAHMLPKAAKPMAGPKALTLKSAKPVNSVNKALSPNMRVLARSIGHSKTNVKQFGPRKALRAEWAGSKAAFKSAFDEARNGMTTPAYARDAARWDGKLASDKVLLGKRDRFYDPEERRQRRRGAAEGGLAAGTAVAGYKTLKGIGPTHHGTGVLIPGSKNAKYAVGLGALTVIARRRNSGENNRAWR